MPRNHAFLSGWDALFLLVGLHLTESLVGSVLQELLQVDETALSALTLLLASAIVFTLAMRFTRSRHLLQLAPGGAHRGRLAGQEPVGKLFRLAIELFKKGVPFGLARGQHDAACELPNGRDSTNTLSRHSGRRRLGRGRRAAS